MNDNEQDAILERHNLKSMVVFAAGGYDGQYGLYADDVAAALLRAEQGMKPVDNPDIAAIRAQEPRTSLTPTTAAEYVRLIRAGSEDQGLFYLIGLLREFGVVVEPSESYNAEARDMSTGD